MFMRFNVCLCARVCQGWRRDARHAIDFATHVGRASNRTLAPLPTLFDHRAERLKSRDCLATDASSV